MAQIIAVWGPTGSPGRTTIAMNVAAELAEQGHTTILVDADSYGGAIGTLLGIVDESSGIAAVCRKAGSDSLTHNDLERVVHHVQLKDYSVDVLTGITRPERWPELGAEKIKKSLQFLTNHYDVIVVDVGFNLETDEEISSDLFAPRRNAATLSTLNTADVIVEVAACDPISLSRFIRAHSQLREEFGDKERHVVLNKADMAALGPDSHHSAQHALSRFAGIKQVSTVRFDSNAVRTSMHTLTPVRVSAPRSGMRKDISALAQALVPQEKVTERSGRFFGLRKPA
jgi:MinD-like ATPase involved in chromosome partitioning or flagellar assembly